jgi:hypothetical protein
MKRKHSTYLEQTSFHSGTLAQAHLAHITSLREARAHHKAITLELRSFYDAIAAETVPAGFLALLKDGVEEKEF